PPGITSQPQSRINLAGTDASFAVSTAGLPPLSYRWWFNATNALVNATNSSLLISSVQKTNAGSYQVSVSNNFGVVTSAVAALTVIVPPSISQQPTSLIAT